MSQLPNLLVIIPDEHRKNAMGRAGHPIVKTPNLDALVARATAEDAGLPGVPLRAIAKASYKESRTGFSEYQDGGSKTGAFMVRWGMWKYLHYAGLRPQLFDLAGDPHEQADRAADGENDREAKAALAEGERRLRAICDPEEVNARAFADQRCRIEELGGEEACRTTYVFNRTPAPSEQDKLREGPALRPLPRGMPLPRVAGGRAAP
ncbi:hypothetical protein KUV26_08910 [Leisingera daeponensis]|uniref:Sulfatase N-terminal domain-containing protein n=1 Tax=Leisingera daeponensis TaxID=405746 RepID=A0ABS7NEB9_9RHOB|nr:hypothetical protein [Leisingera daeponensis]MBY6139549.1 hypothetical protein [Leisingera daeponensis]